MDMQSNKPTPIHFIAQISLAVLFIFCVLTLFRAVANTDYLWAAGISTIVSSVFIVLTRPKDLNSFHFRIFGAYALNIIVGLVMHYVLHYILGVHHIYFSEYFEYFALLVAVAMGVSIALMLCFKLYHPPAVGISLILMVDIRQYYIVLIIAAAVMALVILHALLQKWMRNLY